MAHSSSTYKETAGSVFQEEQQHHDQDLLAIDVEALAVHISSILESISLDSRKECSLPDSWDIQNFKHFLSANAYWAFDLRDALWGNHNQDVKNAVAGIMQKIEKMNLDWVAAVLLVLGFVLERFELKSPGQIQFLGLLQEMYRLCTCLKDSGEEILLETRDLVHDSVGLVVEGAVLCCCSPDKNRFMGPKEREDRLQQLRMDMSKNRLLLMLEMGIHNKQRSTPMVNEIGPPSQFCRGTSYPKHAVGIERWVNEIIRLLEFESHEPVVAVVVHGSAGTGKTTVANAVYSTLKKSAMKFSNVRLFDNLEKKPNIIELQSRILGDISGEWSKPASETQGQRNLLTRFREEPCFLYIDNVFDAAELHKLLPSELQRCTKLRLLLTARDPDHICQSLQLGNPEATKLFPISCLGMKDSITVLASASGINSVEAISQELDLQDLDYLLGICGGVPLALEIVGKFIANEGDKQMAVDCIKQHAENLCFSGSDLDLNFWAFAFERLGEECTDAFYDICCFFLKYRWGFVEMLFGEDVVRILQNRGLIKRFCEISEEFWVDSRDLVGIEVPQVILESAIKISRSRGNRITTLQELEKSMLQPKEALPKIKGVVLQEAAGSSNKRLPYPVSAEALDMMSPCLRVFDDLFVDRNSGIYLALIKVQGKCKNLFLNLIYWHSSEMEAPFDMKQAPKLRGLSHVPTKAVDFSQFPSTLQILDVGLHEITEEQPIAAHVHVGTDSAPSNLRGLTLFGSISLIEIPENVFSGLKSLRHLDLSAFPMLPELPDVFQHLGCLKCLEMQDFEILRGFPVSLGKITSLEKLVLKDCPLLKIASEDLQNLSSLEYLEVQRCSRLKRLPNSLGLCKSLKIMIIHDCEKVSELPGSLSNLTMLQVISITKCRSLEQLPMSFGKLVSLRLLRLDKCRNLRSLSDDFSHLSSLKILSLSQCTALRENCMNMLVQMKSLQLVCLHGCDQLIEITEELIKHIYTTTKFQF